MKKFTMIITLVCVSSLSFAGPFTLNGEQKEKFRTIDLSASKFKHSKGPKGGPDEYLIPPGKTLQITGNGSMAENDPGKAIITIKGKLVLGDLPASKKSKSSKSKKKKGKDASYHKQKYKRCIFILDSPNAELHINNVELILFNSNKLKKRQHLIINSGKIFLNNSLLKEVCSEGKPTSIEASNTIFKNTSIEYTFPNAQAIKRIIKIDRCIFEEKGKSPAPFLWGMTNCDVYGRPFSMKTGWKSAPKVTNKIYFEDDKYCVFLRGVFKSLKGFKVIPTKKPYNSK